MNKTGTVKFQCFQCGRCCNGGAWLGNIIKPADVERWKKAGRSDILRYVCERCCQFVDPDKDGAPWGKQSCPFLEQADGRTHCRIYDARPDICVHFPLGAGDQAQTSGRLTIHSWIWRGRCPGAVKFRDDLVRHVEPEIEMPSR